MTQNTITRRETLAAVLAGSIGISSVTVKGADEPEHDAERYVVGTKSDAALRDASNYALATYRTLDFGPRGGATVGYFDDETIERMKNRDDVRYVEKDHTRKAYEPVTTGGSRDTDGGDDRTVRQDVPWGVDRVGVEEAKDKITADRNATIAVLDGGVDPEHESLDVADGHALADCRFGGCEPEWGDESGHGTHVAGTAAARDNDVGVVGVNPDADLYAVKVMGGDGSGSDSDIAAGIEWCADMDVDVINMSLGGPEPGQILEDAVRYAYENGTLVVAAAGNAGPDNPNIDYPAKYDECIAIAATNSRDDVPQWSSRGETVELAAPGEDILSTVPDDEYDSKSGTSMAAPHVAGIAATLMAHGVPHVEDTDDFDDPGGVRGILRDTAEDLGFPADEQGFGLVNATNAYEEISPLQADTVSRIRATTARFNGVVRTLADADSAEASFQWRTREASEWTETESETLSDAGEFSADVSGLDPNTEYEVRAVANSSEGTETSDVLTFETGLAEVAVETADATETSDTTVSCTGNLLGLEDADGAEIAFEWREEGDSEWTETESQTLEGIGQFGDEISGLSAETTYEVRSVVDVDGTTDAGDVLTVVTEPEPGVPEIEHFDVEDDSNQNSVRARVNWTVSDQDGDLRQVESELRYADDGELIHAVASDVEGGEESGMHTLRNNDRFEGAGKEYEVTFRVIDGEGYEAEEQIELQLDERSPPPTVEYLDVTPSDFLGRPRADVEWAVVDEGGELYDCKLELRYADDDEVLDEATPMVRNEEASGSTSLTDDDEDAMGSEYDVTFTIVDYFDQETTETTRVTIDIDD